MTFVLCILASVLGAFLCCDFLTLSQKCFFLSLSMTIKDFFLCIMPFFIFLFLLTSLYRMQKNAIVFALALGAFIIFSNTCSSLCAYSVSCVFLKTINLSHLAQTDTNILQASSFIQFPKLITNDMAIVASVTFSVLGNFFYKSLLEKIAVFVEKHVNRLLSWIFFPLIPFFIFGMTLKMAHEGVLIHLFSQYAKVLCVIFVSCGAYLFMMYLVAARSFQKVFACLGNMVPAVVSGLTTSSSVLSMPLTIRGCTKNAQLLNQDPSFARCVIPLTSNIHLVGDCFSIIIVALALRFSFGLEEVALFPTFVLFCFYFVINKFSVAGIPGAGILIMMPILEKYLGFSAEMLTLISGIYILFDPIITSFNILGNGAFTLLFGRLFKRIIPSTPA